MVSPAIKRLRRRLLLRGAHADLNSRAYVYFLADANTHCQPHADADRHSDADHFTNTTSYGDAD